MRILFVCFLAMLFFASCKKKEDANAAKIFLNVKYGKDAKQAMDVYLPAGRSTTATPVLILIHGGGWTEGSRNDLNVFVDTLKRRLPNYAIFNISYRLAANGQNLFPAQENDVKAAVEFIFNKRSEYSVSDRFAFIGASAGAHLASLQAYKYSIPVKAKAVVSFFGPTELVQMYNNPPNPLVPLLLASVTGATPSSNPVLYQQSSPYTFAIAGAAPTLLLHGSNDLIVAPSQSALLHTKLIAANVASQSVVYTGAGHGDWDAATYADAFAKVAVFLKQYHP